MKEISSFSKRVNRRWFSTLRLCDGSVLLPKHFIAHCVRVPSFFLDTICIARRATTGRHVFRPWPNCSETDWRTDGRTCQGAYRREDDSVTVTLTNSAVYPLVREASLTASSSSSSSAASAAATAAVRHCDTLCLIRCSIPGHIIRQPPDHASYLSRFDCQHGNGLRSTAAHEIGSRVGTINWIKLSLHFP